MSNSGACRKSQKLKIQHYNALETDLTAETLCQKVTGCSEKPGTPESIGADDEYCFSAAKSFGLIAIGPPWFVGDAGGLQESIQNIF